MAQRQFRSDDTTKWAYKFGDGSDGDLTISSNTTFSAPNESCSGTAGATTLTVGAASFSNGDLILIHQSRGTGAGNWELSKVVSGGGTTTLTLESALINGYTDSGSNQAQIVELKQYSSVTVNSGVTWSAPSWNGSQGGILAFLCNGDTNINGTVSVDGDAGGSTRNDYGDGLGFDGGVGKPSTGGSVGGQAYSGEGTSGASAAQNAANGNAGGGATVGNSGDSRAGGGGGGHSASGGLGSSNNNATRGAAGGTSGNAGLTNMTFGGGGGGSGVDGGGDVGAGGAGGGIIAIFSKTITVNSSTGLLVSRGGNGGSGGYGGGGGGAGGSILLKAETATLNTSRVLASAGSAGIGSQSNCNGGAGAAGRIHLDYSTSYTGTTTPTLDVTQDASLAGSTGNFFMMF